MTREIGHAFGPGDGRIHFNEMEDWNYQSSFIYTDVYSVALHFTGHVLGLRHSNAKGSVMGSVYSRRHKELSQDDIMAIRSLYGRSTVIDHFRIYTKLGRFHLWILVLLYSLSLYILWGEGGLNTCIIFSKFSFLFPLVL